jgi:biotin synthase
MEQDGKRSFLGGANASITGNMLTTSGSTIKKDREMLASLGFDITPEWQKNEK